MYKTHGVLEYEVIEFRMLLANGETLSVISCSSFSKFLLLNRNFITENICDLETMKTVETNKMIL